jgi:phosphotransferase system IIB component
LLQSILSAAFLDPLNTTFSLVIIGLTAFAIIGVFQREGVLSRLSQAAPSLLTAIGVLGTFVGILIGLLNFDVADISRSVPLLLDGMKTAFVTSVFGMGGGIIVKLVSEVAARGEVSNEPKGVEDVLIGLEAVRKESAQTRQELNGALDRVRTALTGDNESSLVTQIQRLRTDVTDEIKASRKESEEARKELAAALDRVRTALTGDNESSLITQIQRLRTDVTDEIKASRNATTELVGAISAEIQKISTTLSENTSKAITEALERSIRDFNEKISEQFGENFKQLNTAVGRLLDWQENYRLQMIANAEALREGAAGLEASRAGLEAIGAQAGALVQAASDLRSLLEGLGKTRAEMDARLEAFRDMAATAAAAMPTIQDRIEELTTGFSRQVEAASQQVATMAEGLRGSLQAHEQSLQAASGRFVESVGTASSQASDSATKTAQTVERAFVAASDQLREMQASQAQLLTELSQGYGRLREDAATIGTELRGAIKEAGDTLRASLAENAAELQKVSAESVRTVGQQLQRTTDEEFRRIATSLDGQVKQLDEAMKTELENALSGLGSQLVSLTGKFVEDYTILTARMREAVNATERQRP